MPSARAIKKRIRSTRNIAQITKAMEAVSAVKMRKSQAVALRSRPYALAALEILKNLSPSTGLGAGGGIGVEDQTLSPLLEQRPVQKICLVVVTSDKGLAGAFNSNVLRRTLDFIRNNDSILQDPKRSRGTEGLERSRRIDVIAVGKKGRDFLKKRDIRVVDEITGIGDWALPEQTKPIAEKLAKLYAAKEYDEIYVVYANFLSVLKQEVVIEKALPFTKEGIEKRIQEIIPQRGRYSGTPQALGRTEAKKVSYVFEPSPQDVLKELLPLLLEIQVYHIILEANASEHSARMVAMKNASENASELIDSLTLSYNKARQAQITKELTEITSGAAALEI
ncbi:MAG: ATP synthase F1 subunit gamma [Parcubacteria group bacterium RIFCSPLOWO2_01_FULL_48_18]|nr:MAG: ATP synthase F1 subunit gamma [Parcubacteria group bacterium RIFCSPHIGHO2_02_FULL_48_10b]OHB22159.1 MAG: ATP synthase F1 subunit gamma [Parcubacteria group bacterium RIFCSPLOWO2_01_FULL_48_18]